MIISLFPLTICTILKYYFIILHLISSSILIFTFYKATIKLFQLNSFNPNVVVYFISTTIVESILFIRSATIFPSSNLSQVS